MTATTEKSAYADIYERVSQSPPGFTLENLTVDPKFLVCRVLTKDTKTRGGIHLPDISQTDKDYAVVLKCQGPRNDEVDWTLQDKISPGDVVWFRMVCPPKMILADGTEIILLRCCGDDGDDVLGFFRKKGFDGKRIRLFGPNQGAYG